MKLITTEEIIQIFQDKGVSLTRKQFNYYSKIGLLYAPERKTKKRVKEPIKMYFAWEIIDRLEKISELKEHGYTLEEIKADLIDGDRRLIENIYKEADINHPFYTNKNTVKGYYSQLLDINSHITSMLKLKHKEREIEIQSI